MDLIRTLIVDDEPLARKGIRKLLAADPEIEIIGESRDGIEAIETIERAKPDLLFLDVQMPEVGGFEVLNALGKNTMPLVIFVTAFDQHALRAFEVHAMDYLLKPVDSVRFRETLQRAKLGIRQSRTDDVSRTLRAFLDDMKPMSTGLKRLMVKSGGKISFIPSDEIDWIEAQGAYACVHVRGKKHLLREKISDLETTLPPEKFVRIHRSTIVNVDRIKEMQPLFHGDYAVLLLDGNKLTLSRSQREKVFTRLKLSP